MAVESLRIARGTRPHELEGLFESWYRPPRAQSGFRAGETSIKRPMSVKSTIVKLIERRLSPAHRWRFQIVRHAYRKAKQAQPRARECDICGFSGYFRPSGWPMRLDARCPGCSSFERHRLLKLWMDRNPIAGKRVLHFAPEPAVLSFTRPSAASYVTADLLEGRADRVLDIEKLDLPDASFDVIICSHVLEHVDDRAALSEMSRVLAPGGFALLLTPVVEGWKKTYENPAIRSNEDRAAHFGQANHLRLYGSDIRSRIGAAGFQLDEFEAVEPYVQKFALLRGSVLFIARKPPASP